MNLLLDTNVVSEMRRIPLGKADRAFAAWAEAADAEEMHISVVTLQELEVGVLRLERRDPKSGAILRLWLDGQVLPTFEDRLLPVDPAVAKRAARLHVPNPRPAHDAFIAATALVHGLAMVTRNVTDFAPMGVRLINPWRAEFSQH